ncbi:MAG TPA: RNase adapter RapZ [Candidatus Dormibacteraeota bacterium]|nr:RNase adapter RapZ [Methylomirabilota bacterium]HWN01759.1 RNase adapter RapZ [Candidatus Dormibacteraeota bacterium]
MTDPGAEPIRFVIITGLSGAGKSYAIKCLEDLGYFCVDNLPTTLIPTFAELCANSSRGIQAIALGVDVREGEYLVNMVDTIQELRSRGHRVDVLFLEASDETLVRRYHETRRRHPLAGEGNVIDGIRAERAALAHLREIANRVIDTTSLTVHQLKDQMVHSYGPQAAKGGLTVSLVSFGFKHGVPYDADLVFDVRFLPNPHFVERLRALDGRDPAVEEFVMSFSESRELLSRLEGLLKFLLPLYEREGKAYLTVAIGCTGGRHRSVMLVEALSSFLTGLGLSPIVRHRDLDRE